MLVLLVALHAVLQAEPPLLLFAQHAIPLLDISLLQVPLVLAILAMLLLLVQIQSLDVPLAELLLFQVLLPPAFAQNALQDQ